MLRLCIKSMLCVVICEATEVLFEWRWDIKMCTLKIHMNKNRWKRWALTTRLTYSWVNGLTSGSKTGWKCQAVRWTKEKFSGMWCRLRQSWRVQRMTAVCYWFCVVSQHVNCVIETILHARLQQQRYLYHHLNFVTSLSLMPKLLPLKCQIW